MVKILAIGDVHFKVNNVPEVDLFINKIIKLAKREEPDLIVILGDVLDTHEKLHSIPLNKAKEFIVGMKQIAYTYVLVGNHDMCLAKDTLVRLWNGSVKNSQDIVVGDALISEKGEKTTVVATTKGINELYEIIQNKAENYTVTKNHVLTLKTGFYKSFFWNNAKKVWNIQWLEPKIENNLCTELNLKTKIFKIKEEALNFLEKIDEIEDIDITVENFLKVSENIQERLYGFRCEKVNWPYKKVDLDPYIFGSWLGSGCNDDSIFTSTDILIIMKWEEWARENNAEIIHDEQYNFRVRGLNYKNSKNYKSNFIGRGAKNCLSCDNHVKKYGKSYALACANVSEIEKLIAKDDEIYEMFATNAPSEQLANINDISTLQKLLDFRKENIKPDLIDIKASYNPLRNYLKKYKQINNKHIPLQYLVNDRETRLKLLAGFIDINGTVIEDGKVIYINQTEKNFHLIYEIVTLARSLGFSAHIASTGVTSYHPSEELRIHVNISGTIEEIPTILPTKKYNLINNKDDDKLKTTIKVKSKGEDEYYGFEVDGSGRFLLSDFTVTHNCNNQQFLNTNHWMNILKEWENIEVVDEVKICEYDGEFFVFVPYVPPGRFEEALNTIQKDWKKATCIFAHQEFYGCKMGAITSLDGDHWPIDYPRVISGHIHSKDKLQTNIYYTGSAMQHAFGESEKNTVAVLEFEIGKYKCKEVDLNLPRKKSVSTTLKKVIDFEIPETKDKIMLSISGVNIEEFKAFKKSKKYKELQQAGIKVKFNQKKSDILTEVNKEAITEGSDFNDILLALINKEKNSYLTSVYEFIINKKRVNPDDIFYL
jgi:DNA repair exonuclease SbcCD nuclease subunit